MRYQIWAEGFCDQGMEGVPERARLLGEKEVDSFVNACLELVKELEPQDWRRWWHVDADGTPWFWVRLFDNEKDARKSFG